MIIPYNDNTIIEEDKYIYINATDYLFIFLDYYYSKWVAM